MFPLFVFNLLTTVFVKYQESVWCGLVLYAHDFDQRAAVLLRVTNLSGFIFSCLLDLCNGADNLV